MALALNLDIDFELADRITVANLQESYRSLTQEISNMEVMMKTQKLKGYEYQDYEDAKKNRKAIKKVLRYFMVHNEAEEFFNAE